MPSVVAQLRSVRYQGNGWPADSLVARYGYDVLGRRIARRVYWSPLPGAEVRETRYIYQGGQVVAETDAAGAVKWKYTWGPGTDNLVGLQDSTGAQFYVVQDQLGSVRGLVKRDGAWVMSQRFSPYGQLVARDSIGGHNWPKGVHIGWTGREVDAETGLTFHRARYYSPDLRRWTQEDPIGYGGGVNLYAYVGGAVLEGRDPSGLIEDLRGGGGLGLAESFRPFTLDPTATSMLDQIPLPDGGAAARKAERENREAQQGPGTLRQRYSECQQNPVCRDQLEMVSARVTVDLVPSTALCKDPTAPCSERSGDGLTYTIRFDPSEGAMTVYGLRAGGLPVDGAIMLTHELAHYWRDPTGARSSESLAVGTENRARAWYGSYYGQRSRHEQSLWFPTFPIQ